jgi:lipoprotein-releasing system ATP-binding protein
MTIVIECKNIHKIYNEGPQNVEVLKGVSLQIKAGEQVAIVGSSGSGKTTLLNMLGGLDLPSSGQVLVAGKDLATVNETVRGQLRNKFLGFVYQFHHLLNEFTAAENVAMPLLIAGLATAEVEERSQSMLARVGLAERASHKPAELSGGERQRVAIARALVTEPACVLLDEPTGNLDRGTALEIQALMADLNEKLSISFVIVTHEEAFAGTLGRKLELRGGVLHG